MPPYHTVQVSVESSMAVWGFEDLVFPAQSWVRRFRGVLSRCDRREFTQMLLEFWGNKFHSGTDAGGASRNADRVTVEPEVFCAERQVKAIIQQNPKLWGTLSARMSIEIFFQVS